MSENPGGRATPCQVPEWGRVAWKVPGLQPASFADRLVALGRSVVPQVPFLCCGLTLAVLASGWGGSQRHQGIRHSERNSLPLLTGPRPRKQPETATEPTQEGSAFVFLRGTN